MSANEVYCTVQYVIYVSKSGISNQINLTEANVQPKHESIFQAHTLEISRSVLKTLHQSNEDWIVSHLTMHSIYNQIPKYFTY